MNARLFASLVALSLAAGTASAEIVASTDWREKGDSGLQERSFVFEVEDGLSPMTFDPEIPDGGYVSLAPPETLPADAAVSVSLLYPDGARKPVGTYRLPFADGVQIEVTGGQIWDSGEIRLSWHPELDLGEPNDELPLAMPTETGERTEGALFPAGDVDFFSFDLAQPSIIAFEPVSATDGINYAFFDADDKRIRDNAPAELPAGTNKIAVWYWDRNKASETPYVFRLRQRILPAPELELPEPEPLQAGSKDVLRSDESGDVERRLIVDKPGLFTLTYSNMGNYVGITWVNALGEELKAPGAFLDRGEYTIRLNGVADNPSKPRILTVYRSDLDAPYEPNDFFSDAKPLKSGLGQEIWFGEASPVHFFKFMPERSGVLTIHGKPKSEICQSYNTFYYTDGTPDSRMQMPAGWSDGGTRWGPLEVKKGEPLLLEMLCNQFNGEYGYLLDIEVRDADILEEKTRNETPIYLVGFQVTDAVSIGLADAAEETGVSFIRAGEGETLEAEIADALEASQKIRAPIHIPVRLILILIVLALGAGFAVYLSVFRKKVRAP